ncbi:Cytochrome c oxidase subunit 5A [Acarospora aff. strigata]|nr:Cytochrome c oxidase subunit 5A [Acarospora aff. strigata]
MYGVGAALGIVLIARQFAREPPTTMTKAYQEQSNEYLKNQNTEPITGVSSEGYKGQGMVQSAKRRD